MSHLFPQTLDSVAVPKAIKDSASSVTPWTNVCIDVLVLAAIILAFTDETLRKILPGQPVEATAPKDALIWIIGAFALTARPQVRRGVTFFLPWIIYAAGSTLLVFVDNREPLHAIASLRSYVGSLFVLASGVYVGLHHKLLGRVKMIFVAGAIAAAIVAVGQEFRRDSLPEIFSTRIYVERHSNAGGLYNEGLFVSPQTLGQCMLVAMVATVSTAAAKSRRLALSAGYLLLFTFAMYLCRIRVAVLMASVSLLHMLILAMGNRFEMPNVKRRLATVVGTTIVGSLFLVGAVASGLVESADTDIERDATFYASATDGDELFGRTFFFIYELSGMPSQHLPLGFGAGTAGPLRTMLPFYDDRVPQVMDTGVFLLVVEFGVVGLLMFIGGILCLLVAASRELKMLNAVPYDVLWSMPIPTTITFWFLLKSHTCISNGFAQMMWFGSLGIAIGCIFRARSSRFLVTEI